MKSGLVLTHRILCSSIIQQNYTAETERYLINIFQKTFSKLSQKISSKHLSNAFFRSDAFFQNLRDVFPFFRLYSFRRQTSCFRTAFRPEGGCSALLIFRNVRRPFRPGTLCLNKIILLCLHLYESTIRRKPIWQKSKNAQPAASALSRMVLSNSPARNAAKKSADARAAGFSETHTNAPSAVSSDHDPACRLSFIPFVICRCLSP